MACIGKLYPASSGPNWPTYIIKTLLTMPRIVKRVLPHREIARLFQNILYFQMNASCGYRDDVVRPFLKLNLLFRTQTYPPKPC